MLNTLLLTAFLSHSVFAEASFDSRRQKILGIVNEELAEVGRLAKQQDYKSPDTMLRLSELYLEKARLYREIENEQYLSIDPERRRSLNKDNYFKESVKFFNSANDAAEVVVKKFPKYRNIGDVYYILAYNNKELGKNELAKKYFKLSSSTSTGDAKVNLKSKLALADFYYNDRKYQEAIPLYEESINKIDEKWWTKDTFNLAWSYYRVKNYDRAIALMKEVHRRSGDQKYIDMRNPVERDIGLFFIDANRMDEASKYYESLGLNYTEQFVKIANSISTQGRFDQAEALLEKAAKVEKNRSKRIDILLAQLTLLDKFGKVAPHLEAAKELVDIHKQAPLDADQLKTLSFQVNKKAAELQKATASDLYKDVAQVKNQKSAQAIAYFQLASEINPSQKAEKVFFQGETAYAAKQYPKALGLYVTAFDTAKVNKETKIMSQSLEGMLSSLGQPGLDENLAEKYYVPVYSRYLSVDSKSNRAHSIYLKLFNTQFGAGDVEGAEKTLAGFASNFPKDYETQEGMLAKVMEHYRKKKDYGTVKSYVGKINSSEFSVSKKYADALRSLMTKIQIEGVQESLDKGEKGVALKGYHQIYENPESTVKAKINAAYNLSALYYELGDANQSYSWGVKAIKDMDVGDVIKFGDSFLSISAGFFLRQHFAASADMSYRLLAKLCKQNSANKTVAYKNAVFISLANGDLNKALEIRNFGKECSIPEVTVSEVTFEVLKDLGKERRWESYQKLLAELELDTKNYPLLIRPYEDLRLEFIKLGDRSGVEEIESKQNKFFNHSKNSKLDIPVDALDLMAEKMVVGVLSNKQRLDSIRLEFPEDVYNNAVKTKLSILDQMATQVANIQKIGSGRGIVEAYRYVISSYDKFGAELRDFTPPGKGPEYVESFKKAMSNVYQPILGNAQKLRGEVRKLIVDNKILSDSNFYVLYPTEDSNKRFVTGKDAVLMERGGRR